MRRIRIHLLLAAAFAACGPCLAQQVPPRHASDAGATQAQAGDDFDAPTRRSAFGKVMAVMISSLQRQARERGHPMDPVRTSATGTPLGIEVGDAFRLDADAPATASGDAGIAPVAQSTGTGGVTADGTTRVTPPEPPPMALAGPG